MNTKETTKKPRYAAVMESRRETTGMLCQAMRISHEQYYNAVFDTGMALLDEYFKGSLDSRFVKALYEHLLKDETSGYWKWLKNVRAQEEYMFYKDVMPVYQDDVRCCGSDAARKRLYKHWQDFNAGFAHSFNVHERLRHFIIQNY